MTEIPDRLRPWLAQSNRDDTPRTTLDPNNPNDRLLFLQLFVEDIERRISPVAFLNRETQVQALWLELWQGLRKDLTAAHAAPKEAAPHA